MSLTAALTVVYLVLFNAAALPAVVRICRRQSSHDLSVWREWIVLVGVVVQFTAFYLAGAGWIVLISPIGSGLSLVGLLAVIYRHR